MTFHDDDVTVLSLDDAKLDNNEHFVRNQIATFSEERDFGEANENTNNDHSSYFWIVAWIAVCIMVLTIVTLVILFSLEGKG